MKYRKTLKRSSLKRTSPKGKLGERNKKPLPKGYDAFVELSIGKNEDNKNEINKEMLKVLRGNN